MGPIDVLTEKDRTVLSQYLFAYGNCDIESIDQTFNVWNEAKWELFYCLFDQQLRITKEVNLTENSNYVRKCICDAKQNSYFAGDVMRALNRYKVEDDVIEYMNNCLSSDWLLYGFTKYGQTVRGTYIPEGTKVMRAIRKVLELFHITIADFDKFVSDISRARTCTKDKSVKITMSIHPLDYLMASHNNSDWSSCYGYNKCETRTVLELMNSSTAIVVYVDNEDNPFFLNENRIPNMMWRTFVFLDREIIVSGKAYPFKDPRLTSASVDMIVDLANQNTDDYNPYVKYDHPIVDFSKSTNIIAESSGLFDFENDPTCDDYIWYGVENTNQSTVVVGGSHSCICCGKPGRFQLADEWICHDCQDQLKYDGIVYKPSDMETVLVRAIQEVNVPKHILSSDYVIGKDGIYSLKRGL